MSNNFKRPPERLKMTLRGHRGMIKARFFLSEGVRWGDAALTGDPLVTFKDTGQA
jgi:hypothetical protein